MNPRVAQTLAVMRLETRRRFIGRRAILIWLLAALPVALMALRFVALQVFQEDVELDVAQDAIAYATIYQVFVLRIVFFFGCVLVFSQLARGDVLDKSLHYLFLAPVRREVVVAGKYLTGLLATWCLFGTATLGSLFFLYLPHGLDTTVRQLLGAGIGHTLAYLSVTLLACVGYGAVFLALSFRFRNPIVVALAVAGWEWMSFLLPPFLKKLTMVHYLEALCPVPVSQGLVALLADPPSPWLSVPGIVALSAAVLWWACRGIRRMEVQYGTD